MHSDFRNVISAGSLHLSGWLSLCKENISYLSVCTLMSRFADWGIANLYFVYSTTLMCALQICVRVRDFPSLLRRFARHCRFPKEDLFRSVLLCSFCSVVHRNTMRFAVSSRRRKRWTDCREHALNLGGLSVCLHWMKGALPLRYVTKYSAMVSPSGEIIKLQDSLFQHLRNEVKSQLNQLQ